MSKKVKTMQSPPADDQSQAMAQKVFDRVEGIIRRNGWAVVHVSEDIDRMRPGFDYTVGLAARGLPELIAFGLPADVGQYTLNMLARRMAKGEALSTNERLCDVFGSSDAVLKDVLAEHLTATLRIAYVRAPRTYALRENASLAALVARPGQPVRLGRRI